MRPTRNPLRGLTLALALAAGLSAAPKAEILWDTYGVPHIFAQDIESMFYAHGWAQMHNHADLILKLYGESRGRAAEYWGGQSNLELDRWIRLNGVPERAELWYQAQDPQFRRYLDAFARGMNDFANANSARISPQYRQVLPISGRDVVGHPLRAVHYMYMASITRMKNEVNAMLAGSKAVAQADLAARDEADAGSNTWSVGPAHSATGKSMLLINPHLLWDDFYTYMEVHLTAPGYDLYGSPQIGMATPVNGFNPSAGWGRTVNTIDTVDFYKLTVKDDTYQFDGAWKPFQHETKTLKIKQPDGSLQEEKLDVRRTVHGPVVYNQNGVTVAMRVAGIDRPKMLEQWFRMGGARNLAQFQDALKMGMVPMWNANYADSQGHIMLVSEGTVPRRTTGDWNFWGKVIPGDTSKTLWTDYLKLEELPKSIDPPSGFLQNANEPPWLYTLPPLDPSPYSPNAAPPESTVPSFRTKRSLRMISAPGKLSFDDIVADKHNTHMELADALLPDLFSLAAGLSDLAEAVKVLRAWDRNADPTSRGAVLFQLFANRYLATGNGWNSRLKVKYDPKHPLESMSGIADPTAALQSLQSAADACRKTYGALDVPWGDVYRLSRGGKNLPGHGGTGGLGLFRVIDYGKKDGNQFLSNRGDTWVCVVEFGQPQRAECLLGYGNASQPGSPHIDDQLGLFAQKKLRPIWRDRAEIERHLEKREVF